MEQDVPKVVRNPMYQQFDLKREVVRRGTGREVFGYCLIIV